MNVMETLAMVDTLNAAGHKVVDSTACTITVAVVLRSSADVQRFIDRDNPGMSVWLRQQGSFSKWVECLPTDPGSVRFESVVKSHDRPSLHPQTEVERTAALLLEQALHEVDAIVSARLQIYADVDTNHRRTSMDRRKFTLADARPLARNAARLLREAWAILDPSPGSDVAYALPPCGK